VPDGIVEPCEIYEHPYVYLGWAVESRMTSSEDAMSLGPPNGCLMDHNISALKEKINDPDPQIALDATERDWDVAFGSGNANGNVIYRLREGIERFLITDINNPSATATAQSSLAVMWDQIAGTDDANGGSQGGEVAADIQRFNHIPGGCNVLYMDGHVEFKKYTGRWNNDFPMTEGSMAFIELVKHH
jgi:prepilin-type processing-associated H-X9-DG protein